jgi:hypothetical protein
MTKSTIKSNDVLVDKDDRDWYFIIFTIAFIALCAVLVYAFHGVFEEKQEAMLQERIDAEQCELYGGIWIMDKDICDDSMDTFVKPNNLEFIYENNRFGWPEITQVSYGLVGGDAIHCDDDYTLLTDVWRYPTCVKTSYYESVECGENAYIKWHTAKYVCTKYSKEDIIIMNQEKIIANQERILGDE